MPRLTLLITLLFALAIGSFAQVTITNSGFATTPGPAVPALPASPPILYTPIVQLGSGQTQPLQTNAESNGVVTVAPSVPALAPEQYVEEGVVQNAPPVVLQVVPATAPRASNKTFDFGVAQFDAMGGIVVEDNGKTLAEVAREQRQHQGGTNARVYSNNDIDKLNQVGGTVSTPSATANNTNDNWSPNNGVITPEVSQPPQNAVGTPAEQQTPTGIIHSPFAPKPQNNNPATGATPDQPQSRPQSEVRPFDQRQGVEIAQNNPQNAPLAQDQSYSSSKQATDENPTQAQELPRTASKLPIVGLAGLFSVSMGIFVRYQRAKAK